MGRKLTTRQWEDEYKIWRVPYAHLEPAVRSRMVRGCKGKEQFGNADEARLVAESLPVRNGEKRWLKVYRCPLCQNWHFGNTKWGKNGIIVRDNRVAPSGSQLKPALFSLEKEPSVDGPH